MGIKARVLIVDDDYGFRKTLTDILRAKGYALVATDKGKTALERIKDKIPDVALIDLKLEDMSGFEVMSKIKRHCPGAECIVLTGYASQASAIKAVNLGAFSYMQKPYDVEQLVVTISRAVEKRQTIRALRESEEKYRRLVESTYDWVWTTDVEGCFTFSNKAVKQLLGYEIQEIVGSSSFSPMHPEDREHMQELYQRSLDQKRGWQNTTVRWIHKDGSERFFESTAQTILGAEGQVVGFSGIDRDTTERKRAEEEKQRLESQLRHAQKMEAVGTLAGGIAHDFNNVLQTVQGYSDLLLLEKQKTDPDYEELREINTAAKRGGKLIQQLLTFSRKVESRKQPSDLNHTVREVKELLARTIPKMIKIELSLAENLKITNADPLQIEQVLMNLAVNAKDAMPDGGKLVIETENVTLDEEYCRTHAGAMPGEYVLVTVYDTGQGMDKETLEHIFEPFYTTKRAGGGTGLGLAMVYGIVKNHEGYIACYSEPGAGTAFKIYLPAIESLKEPFDVEEVEAPQDGTETILLVDDEESILDLGERILAKFGYTVITATNGESALELYRQQKDQIDLVILDLIMPGMGGRKSLEKLLEVNPQARVIVGSGYCANGSIRGVLEAGARGFISKPYEMKKMLREVRSVLCQD